MINLTAENKSSIVVLELLVWLRIGNNVETEWAYVSDTQT